MKYHITSVLQDFADIFSNVISFRHVLHFGVDRSQIEWNMKVKIEISICTGLMLNDHSNPYIESTTVLSDGAAVSPALVSGCSATARSPRETTVKQTHLTESNAMEAYLTTFERMMGTYNIAKEWWPFKLAPQLTGKAQTGINTPSAR